MADMICHKVYELLMSILVYKQSVGKFPLKFLVNSGLSCSKTAQIKLEMRPGPIPACCVPSPKLRSNLIVMRFGCV
jgi:hypothetical protein